jgi:hypothetical protein
MMGKMLTCSSGYCAAIAASAQLEGLGRVKSIFTPPLRRRSVDPPIAPPAATPRPGLFRAAQHAALRLAASRSGALGTSPAPPARGGCRRGALAARKCRLYFLSAAHTLASTLAHWQEPFRLHFLPAHCGHHLNPIEGFWRVRKEKIGAGRGFASLHLLYQRTRQVLRAHQERPIYEFHW